jgi:hypothetical protein
MAQTAPVRERQWWGPVDGTLHMFNGYKLTEGSQIRTTQWAACGWRPPAGLMELLEPPPADRACQQCLERLRLVDGD